MKSKIKYLMYSLPILFIIFISSCKNEKIINYKQEAGVYFDGKLTKFTFVENPEKVEEGYAIINIPVNITGMAIDEDRKFKAVVNENKDLFEPEDVKATSDMFSIGEGVVLANKFNGYLPVRINYTKDMDEKEFTIFLNIVSTTDFPISNLNAINAKIVFGNVFTKPENWDSKLKRYFGVYSNSWYSFILKVTGLKSIPYKYYNGSGQSGITPEEAERWPMSLNEMKVYAFKTREALVEYNNSNPGNELKHEDGEFINTKVTMGNF